MRIAGELLSGDNEGVIGVIVGVFLESRSSNCLAPSISSGLIGLLGLWGGGGGGLVARGDGDGEGLGLDDAGGSIRHTPLSRLLGSGIHLGLLLGFVAAGILLGKYAVPLRIHSHLPD